MDFWRIVRYSLNLTIILGLIIIIALQGRIYSAVENNTVSESSFAILNDDIYNFFPQAASLNIVDSTWVEVYDKEHEKIGYVVYSAPYSNDIYGFGGNTPLIIALNEKQKIIGTKLLVNHETSSYIEYVSSKGLFDSWNGLTIEDAMEKQVDAISGATRTSESVVKSFNKRMSILNNTTYCYHYGVGPIVKRICALLVIIIALFCFFNPKAAKPYRLYFLGLSVIVLGVWQGVFLSTAKIHASLVNSIPFFAQCTFFIILILSICLPLFTNKQFYCMWLCPFGALQELIGKSNKRKITISRVTLKVLLSMRKFILLFIIFLLVIGMMPDLSNIEPFSVFTFRSASNFVLILAGLFLLLSAFISRPWCRFFCPTGQLLDMFKAISYKNIRP